jgi:hypothetical protein
LHRCSSFGLCLDDLPETVAYATQPGDVERDETIEITFHPESGDDSAGLRVGVACAVT